MPRVLVTDPIAEAGIARLRESAQVDVRIGISPDELAGIIGDYDGLAVRSETRVTADLLRTAARLRVVGRAGVGVDNIDVPTATERGIVVVNSPHGNTTAAAELTVAMMLALARKIPQADASLRSGLWDRKAFVGTEVYGKTLGVIGLGKIGAEVARRARAFEMRVVAHDPYANESVASHCGAELMSLEQLLTTSDIVTLHLPLNDRTRGLIGAAQLALMKPGSRLVNCARGGLVDESALAASLASGHLSGAALDVFAKEPPEPGHVLVADSGTVVTPHLGASTEEAQVAVSVDIADQILDVLAGRPARSAVNMPSLTAEALEASQPYMRLGDKIGRLLAQLAVGLDGRGCPLRTVEVRYSGDFADVATGAVTRSVLSGLLSPVMSEPVNLVNAPTLAAARGVHVTETRTDSHEEYSSLLGVTVETPDGVRAACGTAVGKSMLRVVHVDGYEVNFPPEGLLLMTTHEDRPGMIGAVGTLLGRNGVNIAGLNLGRKQVGGRAVMVLMVDDPISPDLLSQIRALGGMEDVRLVAF